MNNAIVIANIGIRQVDGLFCLNDLHRASGNEKRHQPSDWLRTQQTTDLIKECEKTGKPVILSKQGLGTFVCKELVYAYAMWISAKFNLSVIRAFDAMVSGSMKQLPQSYAAALRELADETERREELEQQLALAAPKVAAQDLLAAAEGAQPISNVAKMLKQPRNKFFSDLHIKGWIFRQGGVWVGKSDKVERGYITHSYHNITHSDGWIETKTQVLVTPKGLAKLAEIFGGAV